jgi:hypothetical protein
LRAGRSKIRQIDSTLRPFLEGGKEMIEKILSVIRDYDGSFVDYKQFACITRGEIYPRFESLDIFTRAKGEGFGKQLR